MSAKVAAATAARKAEEAVLKSAHAPRSVLSIPSSVRYGPIPLSDLAVNGRKPGAVIRQVGGTRRVFVLDSNFTSTELDGLSYRIKVLSKNSSINSVLIASNVLDENDIEDDDDKNQSRTLPASVLYFDRQRTPFDELLHANEGQNEDILFSGGYDPRSLAKSSKHQKNATMNGIMRLSKTIKGDPSDHKHSEFSSKVPVITIPHGLVNDAGYALSMGSYVLATDQSRFRIMNPLRGLTFDPVGFSYILPRLGWEFSQISANYPVGAILALTGYEADACDMVECGLATHYIESESKLGFLELSLSQLAPYENQGLMKEETTLYGGGTRRRRVDQRNNRDGNYFTPRSGDINAKFRNVALSGLITSVSLYDAMGQQLGNDHTRDMYMPPDHFNEDPSLVLDSERTPAYHSVESMLINVAASFQEIFEEEQSVEGIMERLREHTFIESSNEEEKAFIDISKELLESMEAQSPLALLATHKLMAIGKDLKQSLESCMVREKKVQMKLFGKEDYINWATSGLREGEFKGWSHKSVKDVTNDEIEALFK